MLHMAGGFSWTPTEEPTIASADKLAMRTGGGRNGAGRGRNRGCMDGRRKIGSIKGWAVLSMHQFVYTCRYM